MVLYASAHLCVLRAALQTSMDLEGPLSMTGILLPIVKTCHEGPQRLLIGSFLWTEKSQLSRLVLLLLINTANTQHEKSNLTV